MGVYLDLVTRTTIQPQSRPSSRICHLFHSLAAKLMWALTIAKKRLAVPRSAMGLCLHPEAFPPISLYSCALFNSHYGHYQAPIWASADAIKRPTKPRAAMSLNLNPKVKTTARHNSWQFSRIRPLFNSVAAGFVPRSGPSQICKSDSPASPPP